MNGNITPEQALARLAEGNKRFASGNLNHPRQMPARRIEVSDAQYPFATILGCSDSRVPPELIFDQGLGDLFVIRVAGHVVDEAVLGSIEYAVEHLHIPLVMVLGHKNCGAVTAAVRGDPVTGHIAQLVKAIQPAVEKVKRQPSTMLENAIRVNIERAVVRLHAAELTLAQHIKTGKLQVVGAYYDLSSGAVSLIE